MLGGFEFAIDGYVGILVEAGVAFHARFGLGAAFEDRVIMVEETCAPLEGCEGVIMLKCVRSALCLFDEVTVRHTGSRPSLWEPVSVELENMPSATRDTADDDVFLIMESFIDSVHGTIEHSVELNRHNVTHSASVGGGNLRMRGIVRYDAFQTVFYDRFQMSCHVL